MTRTLTFVLGILMILGSQAQAQYNARPNRVLDAIADDYVSRPMDEIREDLRELSHATRDRRAYYTNDRYESYRSNDCGYRRGSREYRPSRYDRSGDCNGSYGRDRQIFRGGERVIRTIGDVITSKHRTDIERERAEIEAETRIRMAEIDLERRREELEAQRDGVDIQPEKIVIIKEVGPATGDVQPEPSQPTTAPPVTDLPEVRKAQANAAIIQAQMSGWIGVFFLLLPPLAILAIIFWIVLKFFL